MLPIQCIQCKHFVASDSGLKCKSFPDAIPFAIWSGEHDHREPYPGDNGIRFEPIPEAAPDATEEDT
jgi:hypothetical protein